MFPETILEITVGAMSIVDMKKFHQNLRKEFKSLNLILILRRFRWTQTRRMALKVRTISQ